MAVRIGSADLVEFLLSKGARPDIKNGQGETPLHVAARNGSKEIVEILLKAAADPEVKNLRNQERHFVIESNLLWENFK